MRITKTLESYNELLDVYTQEVTLFEELKKKTNIERGINTVRWSSHSVINCRMFHFDEWLTNPHHDYFCYEQKQKILPKLIVFLALYNKLNDIEKDKFEEIRLKNKNQEYLDELWLPRLNFIEFLNEQKKERENKKYSVRSPVKPSRPNAYRKLAEFDRQKEEYSKNIKSEENCIKEIEVWRKLYESVK